MSGRVAYAEFVTPVWHSSHFSNSVCTLWLYSKGCLTLGPVKKSCHRKTTPAITRRPNMANRIFFDFVMMWPLYVYLFTLAKRWKFRGSGKDRTVIQEADVFRDVAGFADVGHRLKLGADFLGVAGFQSILHPLPHPAFQKHVFHVLRTRRAFHARRVHPGAHLFPVIKPHLPVIFGDGGIKLFIPLADFYHRDVGAAHRHLQATEALRIIIRVEQPIVGGWLALLSKLFIGLGKARGVPLSTL